MTDQTRTIQEIKDKIAIFVEERNWNEFHNPKNLSMSIAIEASELMEIFQWLSLEEAANIRNSDENIHLQEELSDIIIYSFSLANRLGIDISSAIDDKILKNGIKYPIIRPENSIRFTLPNNLNGRRLDEKVIPTVCNLKNMLNRFTELNGNFCELKQWEKRSYKAYCIDKIKKEILNSSLGQWKEIIREHILSTSSHELGASCIDIYLVAYVAENHGKGKDEFINYIINNDISDKIGSAEAIWQVGKGDGVYLDLLNNDGTVKDWNFFRQWVS